MNLHSFSVLCFSFGALLTALLVLQKRRDLVAWRFLNFSLSVFGWGFLYSFWISQNYSYEATLYLTKISHIFAVFIPITWVHFVLNFLNKREPFKYFYLTNYLVAFSFASLLPSDLFISGLHPIMDFKYFTSPGPFYLFFTVIFYSAVPYGFYFLAHGYKESTGQSKVQIGYLIAGTVIGFFAGSCTILPVYKIPFPQQLLVLMPIYPVLTGIALIRVGLFDVQLIADAFQREKLAAIGTMAASLNHELRNPLFVAKGRIEVYLDSKRRGLPVSDSALESAQTQLLRALDIVQRFSDFAKPVNGKKDKEKVILKEVFNDVVQLASNEIETQKIKLIQQPLNGEYVLANRRQLEEVFFNLIINACHAIEYASSHKPQATSLNSAACSREPEACSPQQGTIKISAAQHNGTVHIHIEDNGPGIEKENLRKIFEPFYTTKSGKGTGLGLYITKQLVEKNGGKISVKSRPGEGTTFSLKFKS